jgi:hypothetical protein
MDLQRSVAATARDRLTDCWLFRCISQEREAVVHSGLARSMNYRSQKKSKRFEDRPMADD